MDDVAIVGQNIFSTFLPDVVGCYIIVRLIPLLWEYSSGYGIIHRVAHLLFPKPGVGRGMGLLKPETPENVDADPI